MASLDCGRCCRYWDEARRNPGAALVGHLLRGRANHVPTDEKGRRADCLSEHNGTACPCNRPTRQHEANRPCFKSEPMTSENVSLAFLRTRRSVNISDFRFHDLRHTAASWMRNEGRGLYTVALPQGFAHGGKVSAPQPGLPLDAVKLLDGPYAETKEEPENRPK